MFTFTVTASSAEELNSLIVAAAQNIIEQTFAVPPKTLQDFSLQEIAEHLEKHGYRIEQ